MNNPFQEINIKNIDITEYVNNGGDVNAVYDCKPLIEYLLPGIFGDITAKSINTLMCHKDVETYTPAIQGLLLKNWAFQKFPSSKKKQKIYINKFDLKTPVMASSKGDNNLDYQTSWLNYFLCSQNSFEIFICAYEQHSDFKDSLILKDVKGMNVWHQFGYYLCNNKLGDNVPVERVFEILIKEFPEGLLENSCKEMTPVQIMKAYGYKPTEDGDKYPEFEAFTERVDKLTCYFSLENNLPQKSSIKKQSKI